MSTKIRTGSLVGWASPRSDYGIVIEDSSDPRTSHIIRVDWFGRKDKKVLTPNTISRFDKRLYLISE